MPDRPDLSTLSDRALLIEIMASDAAVSADASALAAERQRAAFAEGDRRWGPDALERSAEWAVTMHADSNDLVHMAQTDPAAPRSLPCPVPVPSVRDAAHRAPRARQRVQRPGLVATDRG